MRRPVFAILIGVTSNPRTPILMKSAAPMVTAMGAFLGSPFFGEAPVVLQLLQPSRQDVLDAFTAIAAQIKDNALFIVMYVGHGVSSASKHEFQSWVLDGDDEFTDEDLSAALNGFDKTGIQNVVISDCCYGAGLFTPGKDAKTTFAFTFDLESIYQAIRKVFSGWKKQLAVFNHSFTAKVQSGVAAPMVCIAGASIDKVVDDESETALVMDVVGAAASSQTYQQLQGLFDGFSGGGSTFQVQARPKAALGGKVLDIHDLPQ